jgi:hypothetical protein
MGVWAYEWGGTDELGSSLAKKPNERIRPKLINVFPFRLVVTAVTTPSTATWLLSLCVAGNNWRLSPRWRGKRCRHEKNGNKQSKKRLEIRRAI